jgi:hypothetical protein
LFTLTIQVEESLLSVEEAYSAIDKQNARAVSSLNSTASDRLDADDQVFNAISKLALRTKPPPPQSVDPRVMESWCDNLVRLRENAATAKLDAAIQNHMCDLLLSEEFQRAQHGDHADGEADLASELSSLRGEIGSVVEMVVSSQLRRPIVNIARTSRQRAVLAQHEWLCYVLATLEHMINHIHMLGTCTDDLAAYTKAFGEVSEAWRAVEKSKVSQPAAASNTGNPRHTRTRTNSAAAGQVLSASPSADLAATVFRRFDITAPTSSSSALSIDALAAAATAAESRLQTQYASATVATGELLGKALDKQRRDWQNVSRPIYAFSDHATVRLMSSTMEESIKQLDGEIERTAKSLEGVERLN